MKKIVISVISIIAALAIILSVAISSANAASADKLFSKPNIGAVSIDFEKEYEGNSADAGKLSSDNHAGVGYIKKAETTSLELYLREDQYRISAEAQDSSKKRYNIAVYDKRTNKLWKGLMDDSQINFDLAESLTSAMQSLVSFSYYDMERGNNIAVETNSMLIASQLEVNDIPNGFRLNYKFPTLSLSFALDFKLDKDRLDVALPPDSISENIKNYDKVMANRNKQKDIVNRFKNAANAIKGSDMSAFSENQIKIIGIRLESIQKQAMDLNNKLSAGGSITVIMQDIQDDISALNRYLGSNDTFQQPMGELSKLAEELSEMNEAGLNNALCGLMSVEILPYFGAGTSSTDGYVFYPDGSGAISYFNRYHPEMAGYFKKDIYTNHTNDVATYLGYISDDGTTHEELTTVQMPIYGVKQGDSAFVSIIAAGDTDAAILYQPSTQSIDIAHINSVFAMRNKTQNTTAENKNVDVIDSHLIEQNRRLRYVFLDKEHADYSGMAVEYRKHLEQYGLLNSSVYMDEDQPPLFLELFMGLKSTGKSVVAEYQKMTSYDDARNILTDLMAGGVPVLNVSLMGWSDAGYYNAYPDYQLKPESLLGGEKELKSLLTFVNEKSINIGLENQFTFGRSDDMTYNDVDIATTKNYGNFTIESYGYHMFNPTVLFNRMTEATGRFQSLGIGAATFANEGRLIYADYNKRAPYTRQQTMNLVRQIAANTKKELGAVHYKNANIYMASTTDWMMNLPESDSRYLLTDESVPFYQMVLHGSIPYTGTAYNRMSDKTVQTLQSIEYGYMPYYLLTNDEPDVRTSYTDFLFSTQYAQWKDDIQATYEDYRQNIADLWKVKMAKHEMLSGDLVRVTYENGTIILINYRDREQAVGSVTVPALSYKVVRS